MHIHESRRVATVEDLQTPWHRGLAAVKLLVEVVAEPADRLRENNAGGYRVAEGRQRNAATPASDPRAHTTKGDRAPDPQAAIPDAQRCARSRAAFTEIRPPIGGQVIQPAADESERNCPQRDVIDHAALAASCLPTPITDQQCGNDADDDEQRIRADGHRPEMPHPARRTWEVCDYRRRHNREILCRTPAASSSVNVRNAGRPAVSAETSAEPTMTPSA